MKASPEPSKSAGQDTKALMAKALDEIRRLKEQNRKLIQAQQEPIAIVGMACRFPGDSVSPEAYWSLLRDGRCGIAKVPSDRWNVEALTSADPEAPGMMSSPFAACIDQPDHFDEAFFGISPAEARSLDPQHRLLLEMAWEAMEDANIPHSRIENHDVGVFVGLSGIDYALKLFDSTNQSAIDPYFGTGATQSPAAGRISYLMRINGPSMVVDTACSSSLVAIHLACSALRKNECEAAFAGGANLILGPQLSINFSKSGLLSPDGLCHTFDAAAQGYSRGEGAGMFLLKRLSDAQADGNTIHALILGSAVNQDGASGGLTVPNGSAQQRVIRKALENAGINPADVDYVEAHGTATPLGDPIEIHALGEVYKDGRTPDRPLLVGSVKTNLGHLEAAAGMASAIKVVQSLRKNLIPPHLHFSKPNPNIAWDTVPIRVNTAASPWKPAPERRRIAGISGFGFAGTNAHVILAETPAMNTALPNHGVPSADLFVLSAKTPDALKAYANRIAESIGEEPDLPSLCRTSRIGRTPFRERFAASVSSPNDLKALLSKFASKGKARGASTARAKDRPTAAFVFTGQGSQYPGMGKALYDFHPSFRSHIDTCADFLIPLLGRDVREIIFQQHETLTPDPSPSDPSTANLFDALGNRPNPDCELDQTVFTQLGIFIIEYALARFWQECGIKPSTVIGHSIGEYAAACIAGVFSLEDALRLVLARGQLMQEKSPAGQMLTVFAEEEDIIPHLKPHENAVSIAAVNGPGIILLSGTIDAIQSLSSEFDRIGWRTAPMRISHAFHSPLTECILDDFKQVAEKVTFHPPTIPVISNVSGIAGDKTMASADYWVRHLRQSVRFCASMTTLHASRPDLLLEIGPEPTLLGLDLCFRDIRESVRSEATWACSLRRGQADWPSILDAAGKMWTLGFRIDWNTLHPADNTPLAPFPGYPFQRKRHWFPFPETHITTQPDTSALPSPATLKTEATGDALATPDSNLSNTMLNRDSIRAQVLQIISDISGIDASDLENDSNLLEMGIDSLMFVRIGRNVEKCFDVTISMKAFYQTLHRIGPLVDYLLEHGKPAAPATPIETIIHSAAPAPATLSPARIVSPVPASENFAVGDASLDAVMREHLKLMRDYLTAKTGHPGQMGNGSTPCPREYIGPAKVDSVMRANFSGVDIHPESNLTTDQQTYLDRLIERLNRKTSRSKQFTQRYRQDLADWKHNLQFKQTLKELKYPIVCDRSEGCRIWDLDGNAYIDIALGMGVHFFGHQPDFVQKALHSQIDRSLALGPQSDLAGEVARKIRLLTGAERVALSVTGSAAVLLAQRLARAATGKAIIAQFKGAYHGIGSEVLVMEEEGHTIPLSPGIPYNLADNVILLDYGSDEVFEILRERQHEIAAIMVEPVQSRRPGYQPHRFLRHLRRVTEELGILLIFDEMINGFRIHPGGSQHWFGIQADLVTYGKIVGGGMPLSAIAGKARYLDLIDGGTWQFGDDSHPSGNTIFTGGTHNRHPIALAASNAVLDRMLECGETLQKDVARRTDAMVRELTHFFEAEGVSLRITNFGSQFRMESLSGLFEQEVFHYTLLDKGIYTWEQRIDCLSTQHTDADVRAIIQAVKESVREMREGGFALRLSTQPQRRCIPMSSVQQRLFALHQREGAEMPYHLSGVWEIDGPIDFFRLQDGFQQVIRRHESLRTAFVMIGDQPTQFIIEEPRFFVEQIDAGATPPDELLRNFIRSFDISEPPLIRVGIARVDAKKAYLLIDAHHLAADGLSMNIILQEFAALYDGHSLPPVPRQCRHAQDELERQLQQGTLDDQKAYWKNVFPSGEAPLLDLPLDYPRPAVADFAGSQYPFSLSPEQTRALDSFAAKSGVSLYMVLLGAFATLLHRLTHTEDLVIGLPVGGRSSAENESVVGMFVNSLPLRISPSSDLSFAALLAQVKERALDAYDHQDYPYGELIRDLGWTVSPDRNPGFDVMFAYENADERILHLKELRISTIDQYEGSGMFDFNADLIRENDVLSIRFHYASSLFNPETIERWAKYYQNLLEDILSDPTTPLRDLGMVDDSESALLNRWSHSTTIATTRHQTLLGIWKHSLQSYADAIAVVSGDIQLTYRELDEKANGLAKAILETTAIQPDDRIGLCTDTNEHWVTGIIAILKCGAAWVPLDPALPEERIRFMLEDCEAKVLLVDESGRRADGIPVILIPDKNRPTAHAPGTDPLPNHLAYVIYTSGSTGKPKGVMIEHRSIASSVQWRHAYYGFSSSDATLQMPSMAFDASVADLFPTLQAGACMILASSEQKRQLHEVESLIVRHNATNLLVTPGLYQLMLTEIPSVLSRLRFVTLAGESIPLPLVSNHFEAIPHVRLINEYGPTENSVIATAGDLLPESRKVSIGRPIDGVTVSILAPDGRKCPQGVVGEIVLGGAGLARGYINRPEAEAAAFINDPENPASRLYHTGDMGRWLPDGTIECLGRLDHQVKIRGYRIELDEITNRIMQYPCVSQACVLAKGEGSSKRLIAYVCGQQPDLGGIRTHLAESLPYYMIPSGIAVIDSIPLTPNGKIDRHALPDIDTDTGLREIRPPQTEEEKALHKVWSEVLKVSPLSVDDDYFRVGGDSIKGIQIASRLQTLGWKMDMKLLFLYPTIETLAKHLSGTAPVAPDQQDEPPSAPLTGIQQWFFREVTIDRDHFNQSVWVDSTIPLEPETLSQSLRELARHHHALRLRVDEDQQWIEPSVADPLETLDLRGSDDAAATLIDHIRAIQEKLNLRSGPMWRALLVRLDAGDRLLLTAHHMAVDAYSWRILIEDLSSAYDAITSGGTAKLPSSCSFLRWATISNNAQTPQYSDRALQVWKSMLSAPLPHLPGHPEARATDQSAIHHTESVFSPTIQNQSITEAIRAFHARPQEVMLAALRLAWRAWNPGEALLVEMEGHGRDISDSGHDLSRTVGWFTHLWPVRFYPVDSDRLDDLMRDTKETLRTLPDEGRSFTRLREIIHPEQFADTVYPEINFNYLGIMDSGARSERFTIAADRPPFDRSPRQKPLSALAIYGYEIGGRQHWHAEYDSARFDAHSIEALLATFEEALMQLLRFCRKRATEHTPSDFAASGIRLTDWNAILESQGWNPSDIEDVYSLSAMQEGLLFENMRHPESEAYFEQMTFTLKGTLDPEAFSHAWQGLVARHPVLRSVFIHKALPRPAQVVFRERPVPVTLSDLRHLSHAEQTKSVQAFETADRGIPFDLAHGPLMRIQAFRLEDETTRVVWSHHHILMDGWCVGILWDDWNQLYESSVHHSDPTLPPPADYRNYVEWLEQADRTNSKAYWKQRLSGFEKLTTIPRSARTDVASDYDYREHVVHLDGDTWEACRSLAASLQTTPGILLQAAWALLLSRINQLDDVTFGLIVSGRPESIPDVERMVGLFINAVPVRIQVQPGAGIDQIVRQIHSQSIERRDHEHLPLAEIHEACPHLSAIFDHLFVFENYPIQDTLRREDATGSGRLLAISDIGGFERTHYDFNLIAVPTDTLSLKFTFNASAFTPSFIDRISQQYLRILAEATRAPSSPVNTIEWVGAQDLETLRHWNDRSARYPDTATITDLFEDSVRVHSDRIALKRGDRQLTYAELNTNANQLAHHLIDKGIQKGDFVGIWLPRDERTVIAMLAIQKCGGIYVPLDPRYPEQRIRFMLEDAGIRSVICDQDFPYPYDGPDTIILSQVDPATDDQNPDRVHGSDDGLYVIYTSGSTGTPKGCLISHRNVVRLLKNERFDFTFGPDDVWVIAHSFCFDFSVWELYGALLFGGRTTIAPYETVQNIPEFVDLVLREHVTILNQTPAAFYAFSENLLQRKEKIPAGASLRYVIFGGDRLEPRYLKDWVALYPLDQVSLINMYGITETTVHVTYHPVSMDEIQGSTGLSLIGRPLPETQVWVLDSDHRMLPIGVPGELYVGGTGVSLGYLNRPELTRERFIVHPLAPAGGRLYKTGDLGRWNENGILEYLGRNDHQVQIRGFRVETGEIEAALLAHPSIDKAFVMAFDEAPGVMGLIAYLVGRETGIQELRDHLSPRIPAYMVPSLFKWLPALPTTPNGKVDRKALPAPKLESSGASHSSARNPLDGQLIDVWQSVLHVDRIGIDDNFFHLGGQSLKAIKLVNAIEQATGLTCSLRDIFEFPTIRLLADQLASTPSDPELDAILNSMSPEELKAHLDQLAPDQP